MATPTKATFEQTARIIRYELNVSFNQYTGDEREHRLHALEMLAKSFASEYERANPRFKVQRFLEACAVR